MVEIDLTTLSGWNDLPDGEYQITVGATAEGYSRIKRSSFVTVVKQEPTPVAGAYLTFINNSKNIPLTMRGYEGGGEEVGPFWDNTMEYSFDTVNWTVWDANLITAPDNVIYLRGTNNTTCSHEWGYRLQMTGEEIDVVGNIENLLDYQSVMNGVHPQMADFCFNELFHNTPIRTAPELPATNLTAGCYQSMFSGCTSLLNPPILPAAELPRSCYFQMFFDCSNLETLPALNVATIETYSCKGMFRNCSKIKISSTQTGEYTNVYRIPMSGTAVNYSDGLEDMFSSTGGTFTGTPTENTTYYTSNEII